jgi:transcriptional regulator with XRE-family HTH domain
LREWRLKKGLRLEDVAQALGTSKSMISRYERDELGIRAEVLFRLLAVLNLTPNELMTDPAELPEDGSPEGYAARAGPDKRKGIMNDLNLVVQLNKQR